MLEDKKENRKDFSLWKTEIVYRAQEGQCAKCENSLIHGYHKHHKDGDNSNNSIENLELLCPVCHGSKQWKTLQKQKKKHIGELNTLINKAINEGMAGTLVDKLLDSIKLALSLEKQVYGLDTEEVPVSIRMESYITVAEHSLEEYIKGIKEGINIGVSLSGKKEK